MEITTTSYLVSFAAVFLECHATLHDITKNGCEGDYQLLSSSYFYLGNNFLNMETVEFRFFELPMKAKIRFKIGYKSGVKLQCLSVGRETTADSSYRKICKIEGLRNRDCIVLYCTSFPEISNHTCKRFVHQMVTLI